MKESKFIELLNLYIDQQIEPDDAVVLEEEIQRNPQRRRIYQQYCRMHRASTLLFEQARPEQAQPQVGQKLAATAAEADEKIVQLPPARRSVPNWIYAGGLAAAACLAVVFINRSAVPAASPEAAPANFAATAPATPLVDESTTVQRDEHSLLFASHRTAETLALSASTPDERPTLEWMRQFQLTPLVRISDDQLAFDSPAPLRTDHRSFGSQQPVTREMTAYQFQR